MKNKHEPLISDNYYHIYNRANGSEKLFKDDDNYTYFLKKYIHYIAPIAHTFVYCLMPNHFHFLVQIKKEEEIFKAMIERARERQPLKGSKLIAEPFKGCLSKYCSQQFSHLFNGYTQAYNKRNNRMGSLFMPSFKKKLVDSYEYLMKLVHYIHLNPVKAHLCARPEDWNFSSFKALISDYPTGLSRSEVIDWFDGVENFKLVHDDSSDFKSS